MPPVKSMLSSVLERNLIFIHGKGGVGKTSVSQAIASVLAQQGAKTAWMTIEDPTRPTGATQEISPLFWHLNIDFNQAFEEYISLKIGTPLLTRIFLQNKLIRYMAKAAPGIHELVLLGKIWFERNHYTHVVVDMPSTGYGLAMFQSTENFVRLFQGGPLYHDAQEMLKTFKDPKQTGHLILALPEEMPLQEGLELAQFLKQNFPKNEPAFLVNRTFPKVPLSGVPLDPDPSQWTSPLAQTKKEFATKRMLLETHNLRIWKEAGIPFGQLEYCPLSPEDAPQQLLTFLANELTQRHYL